MIDLHTHTVFSDGELIPAELARRARVKGLRILGITDHADPSNLELIVPRIAQAAGEISAYWQMTVIPGVELTHVAPAAWARLTREARKLGARLVVAHGETLVEPVAPGTNRAAILAGVDILAHPGLLSRKDAELAREKGVFLEITSRPGHSLSNGHVARLASETAAPLVFNTDSHSPGDLRSLPEARRIVLGAGLPESAFRKMLADSRALAKKLLSR